MKKILSIAVLLASVLALSAFAVTSTNYVGSATVLPVDAVLKVYVMENTVATTALEAGDVVKCIGVPAGAMVLAVTADVNSTNSNGSKTFSMGDTSSTTTYIASINMNAVSTNMSAASTWKKYAGADSINLVAIAAITNGSVKVQAVIAKR